MPEDKADNPNLVEPGTHVFTGTVVVWRPDYGELLTDSGVTVPLVTVGHARLPEGSRVTVVARRYRPLFRIEKVTKA